MIISYTWMKNSLLENQMKDSQEYDFLLFARRDIKSALIPEFIKQIGLYAYHNTK